MTLHATTLSDEDNVTTVLQPVATGETVKVRAPRATTQLTSLEPIAACHKIALADIAAGDSIFKYGECIGEATQAIRRGAWVHTHNLRSRRARLP